MIMDHTVKIIDELPPKESAELLKLFAGADFAELEDGTEWLNEAVKGSMLAAGAFASDGALIGFARVLGDGVSDCYIQDVTVRSDCRRQGIGQELVKFLIAELRKRHIDWIGLIATPGKADFYRKLGFEIMTDHTPMRLKDQV